MKKGIFNFVFFFVALGVLFFHASHAEAATLYFNAGADNDWNTRIGNWWTDAGFTLQAPSLPGISDDVIIAGNANANTGSDPSINTLTLNGAVSVQNVNIIVANGAFFNNTSSVGGAIITGNATFNDTSINGDTIVGDVAFNDLSYNSGTISGDATFAYGTGGTITLTGSQQWGTVSDGVAKGIDAAPITTWVFNNSSSNVGNIFFGVVTFNNSSSSSGTVVSDATFNNSSFNSGTVVSDATFNNTSYNSGTVSGDAIFNDTSGNHASGAMSGDASFYDLTVNSGTVTGNACFEATATNSGTVSGFTTVCASALTVATLAATQVGSSLVSFNGSTSSTGGEIVTAGFNYGPDTSYGTTVSKTGIFSTGIFNAVLSLSNSTLYHFRAFVTNGAGTSYGSDTTFTTGSSLGTAPILYGIDGSDSNPNNPNLYILNQTTGAKTSTIGAVGEYVTGMAFSPITNILYGSTVGISTHPRSLVTINITTGAATYLGTIKDSDDTARTMSDIAFRSDGILFSWSLDNNLYTIDLTSCNGVDVSCLATKVGNSGLTTAGNGLAFDNADNLFVFGNYESSYFQINPTTGLSLGETIFTNPVGSSGHALSAAKFNENSFPFVARTNSGGTHTDLAIVNPTTHTIISTGLKNPDMRYMEALAFSSIKPTVSTSSASLITISGATLNGNITSTGGLNASERGFEYGLTTSYGSIVTQSSGPYTFGAFSVDVSGINCANTYHFRAYATNGVGTSYGSDASFTLNNCNHGGGGNLLPPPPLPPPAPILISPPVPSPSFLPPTSIFFTPPPTPIPTPTPTPTLNPPLPSQSPTPISASTPPSTVISPLVESGISPGINGNEGTTSLGRGLSFTNTVIDFVGSVVTNVHVITATPTVTNFRNITLAVPVAVSTIVIVSALIAGLPFVNYLFYFIVVLAQLLGLKKTPKPWGTIYDSHTKRPIAFARVEILNSEQRKLQSVITDENGRYGFLLSDELAKETIRLQAFRTKYNFPSKETPTEIERELYPNIYQGGAVNVSGGVTNFDLPMDPRDTSTMHSFYFGIVSVSLNNILTNVANILFIVGTVLGITNVITNPNPTTFSILGIIILTFILRKSGFKLKPFGLTKDRSTKEAIPFGFVALHNQGGLRVNFTVSDDKGRYFLLTEKGAYVLKAYTPAHISPTRTKEIPVFTSKGWISREIGL